MADANTHASRRSLTRQAPTPTWLPRARATPTLKKALMSYMRKHQKSDWFAALSILVETKMEERQQAWMLAKVYIFLRDFIPQGLVGRWKHISGRNVMDLLLSHPSEQCPSRHPATRKAVENDFGELEKWMAGGETWEGALANAKAEAKKQPNAKRKSTWYAPGLRSPAAMLALLALAYPDQKYHNQIARLQIGWMMTEARDTLEVREGFWKGITSKNINDVFSPEEPLRRAEVEVDLDYESLFGRNFTSCRRDIRPYLPADSWRSDITVADTVSDVEDFEDNEPDSSAEITPQASRASSRSTGADGSQEGMDAGAIGSIPDDLDIRRHLSPESTPAAEVKAWLAGLLANASNDSVLFRWCKFWADRARSAQNFQEQAVTHSLILQSMRRLKSFYSSGPPSAAAAAAEAYMLLDVGDGQPPLKPTEEDVRLLGTNPTYMACTELHTQLKLKLCATAIDVSSKAAALLDQIFDRQAGYLMSVFRTEAMQRATNALKLEEHRSQAEVETLTGNTDWDPSYPCKRIWDEQVIATLKLTDWQVRASIQPTASLEEVLTDWQLRIYQGEASCTDLSDVPAAPYQDADSTQGPEKQEVLAVFLTDLTPPAPAEPTAGATAAPETPASVNPSNPLVDQDTPTGSMIEVNTQVTIPPLSSSLHEATPVPPSQQASKPSGSPPAQGQHPPHNIVNRLAGDAVTPNKRITNPFPYSGRKRARSPDQRSAKAARSSWSRGGSAEVTQAVAAPDKVNPYPFVGTSRDQSPASRMVKAPGVGGLAKVIVEEFAGFSSKLNRQLESWQDQQDEVRCVDRQLGSWQGQQDKVRCVDRQQDAKQLDALGASIQESVADIGARLSEMRSSALTDTKVEDIVQSGNQTLSSDLASQGVVLSKLDAKLDALAARMDQMHQDIRQELQSESVSRLSALTEIKSALLQMTARMQQIGASSVEGFKSLTSTVEEIKGAITTPPSIGEPGYLTSHCLAPEGTDQKAYDAELCRAAVYYFSLFDHPADGVTEEGESFEVTMGEFPSLPPAHLVTALGHMHMQVYNRPMGRPAVGEVEARR